MTLYSEVLTEIKKDLAFLDKLGYTNTCLSRKFLYGKKEIYYGTDYKGYNYFRRSSA